MKKKDKKSLKKALQRAEALQAQMLSMNLHHGASIEEARAFSVAWGRKMRRLCRLVSFLHRAGVKIIIEPYDWKKEPATVSGSWNYRGGDSCGIFGL